MLFFVIDEYDSCIPRGCTSIRLRDDSKLIFLCTFLQGNTTIKEVNLTCTRINDEGAKAIAKTLKVNCTITFLNLGNNFIGVEGAKVISEALKVNCTVTKLNLESNEIGDEGAKVIAEALKVNRTIKKLILSNDQIGSEGAKAIAKALKVNRTVKVLDLMSNQIGDKGAKAIAEALKVNCTINHLNLAVSSNQIGEDGAKAIAEALKVNCTVMELYLSMYAGGAKTIKEISKSMDINMVIRYLLKPVAVNELCQIIALGVLQKVPIYMLLDIIELLVIQALECGSFFVYKFYKNPLFLELLERKVSKKRLLNIMDKINRKIKINS